ncbi:E3 ubiquitin-protein ligase MBR1-like isoform X1 [Prunus yedoensis var. nudiflora]|uniref:RING-type E3 ubiquitin transferase n=1 Tax=Prunus yedoensis var. nudiflora TaxID=2094558 RepID=A0A314ZC74_PRUYE|nr:E3 ubiquitin-protein ligase MBR1-like isoform X1 [Prunus yedoensis var. nudiflora]
MPSSFKSQVILSIGNHHDQPHHFRKDRCMDDANGSCKGKNLEFVSGCSERNLRGKLDDEDDGITCSQEACYAGSQSKAQITTSKCVEVEVSTGSSSSSSLVDIANESSNHISLGAHENAPLSTQGRLESRDDLHDVENISTITGSNVREGGCIERVSNSLSSDRTNKGSYTSTKLTQASKMQWPKFTVSHMLSLSSMEKVMNYYRVLNLADDLNDEDLRCFLEEQLSKEKAGLSETHITNRLRTKLHVSETVCEPDSCSICMIEYKDQDKIASLYYCPHDFHSDCIKEWLLKNNLCPMCRALAIIPEDYPSYSLKRASGFRRFTNKGVAGFDSRH